MRYWIAIFRILLVIMVVPVLAAAMPATSAEDRERLRNPSDRTAVDTPRDLTDPTFPAGAAVESNLEENEEQGEEVGNAHVTYDVAVPVRNASFARHHRMRRGTVDCEPPLKPPDADIGVVVRG